MSHPKGNLPAVFQALEARLSELQASFTRGELDADAYQAEVQGLTVQDDAGQTWWLGGEAGAWHIWDGSAWVRRVPPAAITPTPDAPIPKAKRSWRPLAIGCGVAGLILVVAVAIFLIGGWQALQQEPMIVEGVEAETLELSEYAFSTAQSSVIERLGKPDAFTILFYEEEQVGGTLAAVVHEGARFG